MKQVEKTAVVWFTPEQMFALVNDIPRYPEFLPWCDHAHVIEEDEHSMTAEVGISFSCIRQSFVTRNEYESSEKITLKLVRGPFSHLDGEWRFIPLAGGASNESQACRVSLTIRYDFNSAALKILVGPVFDKIANTLVEAFAKRAKEVYV